MVLDDFHQRVHGLVVDRVTPLLSLSPHIYEAAVYQVLEVVGVTQVQPLVYLVPDKKSVGGDLFFTIAFLPINK